MENTINIKIQLNNNVDRSTYLQIINALSECMLPVNEITLNNKTVYDNIHGFIEGGTNDSSSNN